MLEFLLPIIAILVPVFAVIGLTAGRGKELTGSCGGVANGRCTKCGKAASEIPARDPARALDPSREPCR